ncbi:Multicopper oxidase [Popillia japonica]|uniref:Multicopper oxidase n=1 Tax=Popillia japonica TaxID=7064 RepID=A0AAW1KMK1_POPJA
MKKENINADKDQQSMVKENSSTEKFREMKKENINADKDQQICTMLIGALAISYSVDMVIVYICYTSTMSSGMVQIGVFLAIIYLKGHYGAAVANDQNSTTSTYVEYVLLQKNHPCSRKCVEGDSPMVCRYNFTIEWYQTMSKACYDCPLVLDDCKRPDCITGDGRKRSIVVVNRQMPGPSIEVCVGDEVVVHVHNHLMTDTTTIHWHGHHQRGTPYMDGVPFVTQCPIQPGTTFTYKFVAANVGTHFWHSHSGMQRADGAFGPFIVRQPKQQNPHSHLYDYDLSSHVMTILDWTEETGMQKFVAHHHSNGDNKPTNILVNGKGRFLEFIMENGSSVYSPVERFYVNKGYRYRFRIINAEFLNCPIEVSVDNHTLTIISSDGNDIAPIDAESVVTYAGERFDFIINANKTEDLYWMRFRGLMDCDERFKSAHQRAYHPIQKHIRKDWLQYTGTSDTDFPEGLPSYTEAHKEGLQVNALNVGMEERNSSVSIPHLQSLNEWDRSLTKF